ncbi:pentatricopeptide repeat-containing protein At1g32415, mitochondrial [Punica granatum]|uniref:Pentatricopeptide repeat-containing protein At1g32415, mitochondrial n=1 Tax=Punica granatum TaxID=22663 RepID=A0A218XUU8_PUNGR|nr:pentatricopeptide repeat-containing protein At1g32415, mitochondrial [Punica granatum]XP_031390658.1 pentatricopeptide repeat-containing protein At1g32415, mitochondrial [Punica granatum]OWM88301.1 hypothetical protein CDL15_Pgr003713 [Punica granatum]
MPIFRSRTIARVRHLPFSITQFANLSAYQSKLLPTDLHILHCITAYRFHEARNLLDRMPQRGQYGRVGHWTALLSRFSRVGLVDEARALFDIMPEKNLVTHNAMLSALVQGNRLGEAVRFFERMPEKNVVSRTSVICGLFDAGRIDEAKRMFGEMPERNVVSWNAMIAGLIRNGHLEEAGRIFYAMPVKNVVSWNAMIAGYAESGRVEEARALFEEMGEETKNVVTWTSMVAGYCRSGDVEAGYSLFSRMPEKNVVSWTAMISGLTWNGFYEDALLLFREMSTDLEVRPNEETFVSLSYACGGIGYPLLGKQLHAHLVVDGLELNDYDGRLSKGLIHMYSLFGLVDSAHHIFAKNFGNFSVQSLNSIINGYIRIGQLERARDLFETAPILDKVSWTSMISGYLGDGQVLNACDTFDRMPDKDSVAWTAMVSGHVDNELFNEAVSLFSEMRVQGIHPLAATYSVLLGAAGAIANLDLGRQYHCLVLKSHLELDLIVQNSLISMYSKCGKIEDAYDIFSNLENRDVVSWNTMIMGFSNYGMVNESLRIFEAMLNDGTPPNSVTFLGILSACSHAGLVTFGKELFRSMSGVYAINPTRDHYICMIDLLGRAGKVEEAEDFVLGLPFEPDSAIWGALLGVCGLKNNHEVAARAAQRLLKLEPLNGPAHVVLCNIYAAKGQHVEERVLRKEMGMKGVKKVPGCSWVLIRGRACVLLSGDKLPPEAQDIVSLLCWNIANHSRPQA